MCSTSALKHDMSPPRRYEKRREIKFLTTVTLSLHCRCTGIIYGKKVVQRQYNDNDSVVKCYRV